MNSNIDNDNQKQNKWEQVKNYLNQNVSMFKSLLIMLTVFLILYIILLDKHQLKKQTGGGPVNAYSKGIGRIKGGVGKLSSASPISGAFSIVFSFINTLFMIFGIVIILILIPTLPIMLFLVICYYICRRKIWALRTM